MSDSSSGGSPAPVLTEEDRKAALAQAEAREAVTERAAAGIDEAAASGKRIPPETNLRVFLSPQHPYTKFLVEAGRVMSFRAQDSPTGKRDTGREGDVFAQFVGGVLATDDPKVIAWCEAHGPDEDLHQEYHRARGEKVRECRAGLGVCCDAKDPNAGPWVEMKAAQIPTAAREATMSPGMNVDAILQGKVSGPRIGGEGERLVDAARATEAARRAVDKEG